MDFRGARNSETRFSAYVEGLVSVIGHADRAAPLRDYCLGLVMPGERKSVEPIAAVTAPARVAAQHQSLLHFVGNASWSDAAVLAKVGELVVPAIEGSGPVEAWIIDDTSFPKKGRHSVGVTRQYCGQLGKQDNCQVAVSLSIANHHASLPVAYRMYLPQVWSTDAARRRKAGVPEEIVFKTKPEIALEQIRGACEAGIARGVVLMDAGYGSDTRLRANLGALGLTYVAGIMPNTSVWMPGMAPLPPKKWSGQGRPPKLIRRDAKHRPISVKALALGLPAKAWRTIRWREGSADWLSSRFARLRVRVAHRDYYLTESRAEEWLLIEWPKDESAPTKYWLASVADDIAFHRLVEDTAIIIDGIPPYRWLNPNAPAKWLADVEKWRKDFGVSHEHLSYKMGFWNVEGSDAYAVIAGTLAVTIKGQTVDRTGTLAYTFSKHGEEWKIDAQAWGRTS